MKGPSGLPEDVSRCFHHRLVDAYNHEADNFTMECAACAVEPLRKRITALEEELRNARANVIAEIRQSL